MDTPSFSVACLAILCATGLPAIAGDIPKPLDGIVFGAGKRPVTPVMVQGVGFDSIASMRDDNPYLLWPNGVNDIEDNRIPTDPTGLASWLDTASNTLGFEGFSPEFVERYPFRTHEVLKFRLVRDGAALHDAELRVHIGAEGVIGIVTHLDGRIGNVDAMDLSIPRAARVYQQVRGVQGGIVAKPARLIEEAFADRTIRTIVSPEGEIYETEHDLDPQGSPQSDTAVFTEYTIPGGIFPDQISVAGDGRVWLSDPSANDVVVFVPDTEQFTAYPTTGGSGPDGLIVGTQDRVWTGLYFSGAMGVMDQATGQHTPIPVPYSPSAPAIPVETSDGKIWVTDHAYNRISEYDPATGQWLQSLIMPTPGCWVVQGHEDQRRRQVYFTEYSANQLGRIDLGGSVITDIRVPGGGPAFCVYSDDKVYYSRWLESGIGVLDVPTGQITEYNFPVNNEQGGPLWLRPGGDIVTGTRGSGYIMVFHVDTATFSALKIPTNFPGLKDGLTVGADDTIWFTETGVNKLGKLEFCLDTCPGDFNGDGNADTLDVLDFLNAWAAGEDEADFNEDGEVNTLDVLSFLNAWAEGC